MKRTNAESPYDDYYLYGPYFHKNEGRYYVNLLPIDKSLNRTTVSLARYKMAVSLERFLLDSEEVDHINDDKTDDSIENLQILTPEENKYKENGPPAMAKLTCAECEIIFEIKLKFVRDRAKRRKYPPCCSRSCAGKYQRKMELR